MRTALTIIGLFLGILCFAKEKKLAALRIHTPIRIDGNLEEAVWKQAAIADSFIANSPDFGKPSSRQTIIHILYDDQAVYVGATNHRPQSNIFLSPTGTYYNALL